MVGRVRGIGVGNGDDGAVGEGVAPAGGAFAAVDCGSRLPKEGAASHHRPISHKYNACESSAVRECHIADTVDAVTNDDSGKIRTTGECELTDTGDAVRDRHAGESGANTEC